MDGATNTAEAQGQLQKTSITTSIARSTIAFASAACQCVWEALFMEQLHGECQSQCNEDIQQVNTQHSQRKRRQKQSILGPKFDESAKNAE